MKSPSDEFDEQDLLDWPKAHGIRVAYAMHRAIYTAMDTEKDGIEFEVLRLLRSWGFEVVELAFVVGTDGPPTTPEFLPDLGE